MSFGRSSSGLTFQTEPIVAGHTPGMDRRTALALYIGLLVVDGVVIATRLFPQPIHLVVVVAVLVAAFIVRTRVLHAPSYSRIDFIGAAAVMLSFVGAAFVLGRWPFR
jgi:hypothetical protein